MSGAVVALGNRIGICLGKIPFGQKGALVIEGVHSLAKKAATAFAVGAPMYWDASPGELTDVAADGVFAGYAPYAAESADTSAYVLLAPGARKAANVAFAAGANLTAVPGSFADVAAVRTYLLTLVSELETRLDALDTGLAAEISAVKAAGLQASA